MKNYVNNTIMVLSLMTVLLGCKEDANTVMDRKEDANTTFHAKSLQIDRRYKQEIDFDILGISIPIKRDSAFIRIDEPVADVNEHQRALLRELGVSSGKIVYSNPASHGRHMYLTFADGKTCSFIWVLKHPDDRITRIRIEHEKYHALCRISPKDISFLSEKIRQIGFHIDLRDYNEELSATIVETLCLHQLGIPLDQIWGSELTEQARDILVASKCSPDKK